MKTYNAKCAHCQITFNRPLYYKWFNKNRTNTHQHIFCSRKCCDEYYKVDRTLLCSWCNKTIFTKQYYVNKSKSGRMFCNRSCAASFNNTQRRKSRRSKSEILLATLLKAEFPNIQIIENDKTMLDGLEIDIAFPCLKLGIEWNGIVHFQPIYGETKLNKIQNIDNKKQIIAQQKGIELIIVPDLVSRASYVKEAFLNISRIIRSKL